MNTTVQLEKTQFEREDTAHAFFKSSAFEEFATDPRNAQKREAVKQLLQSYGSVNRSLIDGQLISISHPMIIREMISEIILELER
ncbi:MAG: hypothetical protein KBC33_03500 [Candidatus Pacebacteria bacterium]|nr:hypothetical protein [Candidatus Paceibacterota bacterium]